MSGSESDGEIKDAVIPEKEEEAKTPVAVPKRKIIRAPQPKLDAYRLKGERGLKTLVDTYKNVKLKGVGHEEHDLNLIMKNLELWCNRLFPKMAFDDCLERIEKLGSKKIISVILLKISPNFRADFGGQIC